MKRTSHRRAIPVRQAHNPQVEQSAANMSRAHRSEPPRTNIEMEVFRNETGEFGVTVVMPETMFQVGPFNSFLEAQDTLRALVDDIIHSNADEGRRVGIRSVVLAHAPSTDM